MKKLAVYTDTDDLDPQPGVDLLTAAGFDVTVLETHDADEIIIAAKGASALLVGYAQIDARIINALENLEVISMLSTGSDNVDHSAVKARGIELLTLGALPAQEVATHTAAITLSMLRGVRQYTAAAERLEWFKTPYPFIPPRISQLTLGLVGFGRIGALVGAYLAPIFGKVKFYDPMISTSDDPRFSATTFDDLIETSDVISINVPASADNRNLFNAELFARMKKGSYLVNASRGSLVDSKALAAALASKHLAGAALDVLDTEPADASHPLVNNERVLMTPHVAYLSEHTLHAYITVQAGNVIDFFSAKMRKSGE